MLRALRPHRLAAVMVDVGAHYGSTLERFVRDGYAVVAFEPDPKNRIVLARRAKAFDGVVIDDRAVSNESGRRVSLFTSEVSSGISALSAFHDSHAVACTVETVTLADALAQHAVEQVDFLKIDTEGHDLFVLQGVDWSGSAPSVVMCEFEDRKTVPLGYDVQDLIAFLRERGYAVLLSEWFPVVEYGRRHRWRRFCWDGVLADPRGWGNLIAARGESIFANISAEARRYVGQ